MPNPTKTKHVREVYKMPSDEDIQKLDAILRDVDNLIGSWRADQPITDDLYRLARDFEQAYTTFAYPHRSYTLSRWTDWRDTHVKDTDTMEFERAIKEGHES